ncbi:MAG: bifunctional aminoglycoside phosphotransferase/ATP-binding protein [Alphaproteobacteria bacterium]
MPGQDAVFAFMGDPSSYDSRPESVKRIDTHAAVIFLAGGLAYKIKRAVRLRYLDFSTLDKRRAVCEREVAINKLTAPDIYIGVEPIMRRADGTLAIGGAGEPVEWAVKMRRFRQAGLFDTLAREGALSIELMTPLAATIAELHTQAKPQRGTQSAKVMAQVISSITESLTLVPPLLDQKAVKDFTRAIRSALRTQSALIDERARKGYVRRCHGDLHLQNIVLIEDQPVLFDAIEFDEALATIDIFYDLAFLLMDLWHRGLKDHANALFNAYLRVGGGQEPLNTMRGLALIPLFLATRAGVRAMVTVDKLPFVTSADHKEAVGDLTEFFELANAFLHPPRPELIAVAGLSGTGKSTLAAALAPVIGGAPGALVVRSDVERKRLAGVDETTQLKSSHYSAAATGRVYAALSLKAKTALAAGHSVILDAVFARQDQRERVEQIAREAKVPFTGLWLEAPDRQLIKRVEARTGDASDADADVVRRQLAYETGHISWQKVDASGKPDIVKARALEVL